MTWLVSGLMILFALLLKGRLKLIPGKVQSSFEVIFEFLEEICVSTLGKKDGRRFLPLIATIFVFVLLSNWIGIIPNLARFLGSCIAVIHNLLGSTAVTIDYNSITDINLVMSSSQWYSFLLNTPNLEEPTRSIYSNLALALLVSIVAHSYGITQKGFLTYLKEYCGDIIPVRGWWLLVQPFNILLYINIIGKFSEVISHAFRLFGNIFGGGLIIVIVSSLVKHVLVPVPLYAYFGLFAGLVQAFVFTMLAVTYIAQNKA